MGRNAPMGAWTDAFAQNLRVTESDGCFPLFKPYRKKRFSLPLILLS